MPEHFIPPHGGYENLLSFQKARIVPSVRVLSVPGDAGLGAPRRRRRSNKRLIQLDETA